MAPDETKASDGDLQELVNIVKATVIGGSKQGPESVLNAIVGGSESHGPEGSVEPPYDFRGLYRRYEDSTLLRPNVESYMTNIDSFGHHFIPSLDLSAHDAGQRIFDAMLYEQMMMVESGIASLADLKDPTDDQVNERMEQLRRVARLEYARLRAFFNFIAPKIGFLELRRRTRQDLEVIGNAFWEITRNQIGEIASFYYAPPLDMRLMPLDDAPVHVTENVRITDISWINITRPAYFRRYVKTTKHSSPIFFKEFGDPRTVSRATGKYYKSRADLKKAEPTALAATEIMHFAVFSPTSPYGIPRWISGLPGVLGSRELDEVNYNFFQNNVVPPLALLCSGGRLGADVAKRIEEYIDEHLKGRKGVHRILVLEAEGQKAAGQTGPTAVPKVQFIPLRDARQTDALFQKYDARNEDKIAKLFRIPKILRGDDASINRATALAALKFADEQVFEPLREEFDGIINQQLFPAIGVSFWLFRSNAPIVRDPDKMSEMLERLVRVGILLPREAREIASDVFNKALVDIGEEWTNRPMPFVLAQLHTTAGSDAERSGLSGAPEAGAPAAPHDDPNDDDERDAAALPAGRPTGTPLPAIGD